MTASEPPTVDTGPYTTLDHLQETSLATLPPTEQAAVLTRYEILEEIGRGAMGVVYRARHKLLGREVAVKLCILGAYAQRFQREAKLLAGLKSPYLVTVHDFDLLPDGRGLLVMDWIRGQDLAQRIKQQQGPLPETTVLPWMRQVAEAMRVAASQGIVHRDLKPSNILIDLAQQAHVVDFGLARSATVEQLSHGGDLMGTPYYMAPEQAEDPRTVDTRADVYSFGATFYHALTGKPPFEAPSMFSVMFKHKTEPLISPKAVHPPLSDRLSECLERCLAKSPAERFSTFDDVLASLQPTTATAPWQLGDDGPLERYLQRFGERRRIYLWGDPQDLPEPDPYLFPQQRRLTIGFGDILNQDADVLVNSCTNALDTTVGVSAALAQAAGQEMETQLRKYAPVRPGRAVVTTAGRLQAQFIFHGVTIGFAHGWVMPSRDLITEIMESCFYHADSLYMESMAFPLLGTGGAGFAPDICLDTMFRYLCRKLHQGLTTVRTVRLVLYPGRPKPRPPEQSNT